MKHKSILTVIVVMIAILSNMNLIAQGVDYMSFAPSPEDVTSIPVDDPCDNLYPWDGAKERTVSINGCEYIVVFYDRTRTVCGIPPGDSYDIYEVNVVAIFYKDVECRTEATKEEIVLDFLNEQYDEFIDQNPDFYNWGSSGSRPFDVYITGGCYQTSNGEVQYDALGNPIQCFEKVLCKKQYQIFRHDNPPTNEYDRIEEHYNPPIEDVYGQDYSETPTKCTSPCIDDCFGNLMYRNIATVECEFPCNTGEWTMHEKNIDVPGCPGCSIKVEYMKRETDNCAELLGDVFQDIQVSSIHFNPNCDVMCITQHDEQFYLNLATEKLIQEELISPPNNGDCITNVRLLISSCWGDFTYQYPLHRVLEPCGYDDNCCIGYYEVCKDSNGNITYSLIDSINPQPQCHYWPYGCFSICFE